MSIEYLSIIIFDREILRIEFLYYLIKTINLYNDDI
jgi:hypothetical protein